MLGNVSASRSPEFQLNPDNAVSLCLGCFPLNNLPWRLWSKHPRMIDERSSHLFEGLWFHSACLEPMPCSSKLIYRDNWETRRAFPWKCHWLRARFTNSVFAFLICVSWEPHSSTAVPQLWDAHRALPHCKPDSSARGRNSFEVNICLHLVGGKRNNYFPFQFVLEKQLLPWTVG